ncbi:NUDIX hydrolase [Propioniferax innocua]|uniref:8-oxo-dGTP pyrophosphatase MutT (NUDIX family) n=1 Tax=Propioniferax innocua TaxID=1753 RepID=A0A542ZPK1_9ACTN|nr:NUDIX hydrolase [Propioniferax innocua]TQL62295.1 8-oxo-dGTP pyrophosphatase MutT (NUDIX family) [Propioniferax innocua]
MTDFQVKVHVNGHIGRLEWSAAVNQETLDRAVSMAADDVLIGRGVHRVEVGLPAPDVKARRAVIRAGFRQEGVRRDAMATDDGYVDVVLYSRLVGDIVTGQGGFSGVMNSVLATKRVIAHCIFRDRRGRILLCNTHYKPDYELPGGVVEKHESPRIGVIREVAEEIGLEITAPALRIVDWLPPALGWDDALQFLYDGGTIDDAQIAGLRRQESEIASLHWVSVDDLGDVMSERSTARIKQALDLDDGQTLMLEDGMPVASDIDPSDPEEH